MRQNTRMWIDGNEVEIPTFPCCSKKCDGTSSHILTYDGNNDGVPDNITSDGNTIMITPTDVSTGECENAVTYELQKPVSGVAVNSSNAVIFIDCGIASQESCNLTILIDTLCDGTVIGTRSIGIVLTCGDCDEEEATYLNYDSNNDGTPDNVTSDNTTVTVTPVSLQSEGCIDGTITYVLNPEETPEGATIDENTAVITLDCQLIATANKECAITLDVYPVCNGEYIYIDGEQVHVLVPLSLRNVCTIECPSDSIKLDYDIDNDGTPDNVTSDSTTVTVTPVNLASGECDAQSKIVYSLATAYDGVTIDSETAVIHIDCSAVGADLCELDLTIITNCIQQ